MVFNHIQLIEKEFFMSPNLDIELKPVIPKEYPTFIKNLQEAFSPAIIEKIWHK